MQNKGRGKAAKVVNFVAKWLNLCLSTVFNVSNGTRAKMHDNFGVDIWFTQFTSIIPHIEEKQNTERNGRTGNKRATSPSFSGFVKTFFTAKIFQVFIIEYLSD